MGLEPSTFCMASQRERSRPFAPVRSKCRFAEHSENRPNTSEPERTLSVTIVTTGPASTTHWCKIQRSQAHVPQGHVRIRKSRTRRSAHCKQASGACADPVGIRLPGNPGRVAARLLVARCGNGLRPRSGIDRVGLHRLRGCRWTLGRYHLRDQCRSDLRRRRCGGRHGIAMAARPRPCGPRAQGSLVATRPRSRRIGMAGKSKKHRVPNPVSLGTEAKAPMLSLKVKKQKKRSRGK
jgi:hypothetical protein